MKNLILILFLSVLGACNGQTKSIYEKESKSHSSAATVPVNPITDGIIYFSNNNGLSWENKSEGLPDSIGLGLGAIAASKNTLALATKNNGVYIFDSQRNQWISIPTDKKIIESNPGTLVFFKDGIYVGTQKGGVFSSANQGRTWINLKTGLANVPIRKLVQITDKLYAGTDAGLYSYNDLAERWELEYGNSTMQVNGITSLDGSIFIGTNQGIFTSPEDQKNWKPILANRSIHNISSDDKVIYAMVYNQLLSSVDKGQSWRNIQQGLPAGLYTFNVIKNGNFLFAGQWDGVYRKDNALDTWKSYSKGLPEKFAITNMKLFNGIIVVSGHERKLKTGMSTNK